MSETNSRANTVKVKAIDVKLRDINLTRLYGVLNVYLHIYPEYEYQISRHPKYYELIFHGEAC